MARRDFPRAKAPMYENYVLVHGADSSINLSLAATQDGTTTQRPKSACAGNGSTTGRSRPSATSLNGTTCRALAAPQLQSGRRPARAGPASHANTTRTPKAPLRLGLLDGVAGSHRAFKRSLRALAPYLRDPARDAHWSRNRARRSPLQASPPPLERSISSAISLNGLTCFASSPQRSPLAPGTHTQPTT